MSTQRFIFTRLPSGTRFGISLVFSLAISVGLSGQASASVNPDARETSESGSINASIVGIVKSAKDSTPLVFKVAGLRNGNGFLAMSLFDKSEARAFPSDEKKAFRTFYVSLDGKKEIEIPVADLPAGDYAVSVMHDEESDHKMHFNLVGIPVEGFGFSNNPTVYFGPPSFKRAELHVDEKTAARNTTFEIKMKYLL